MNNINKENKVSEEMYLLAKKIFPICRSIMGEGNRKTLSIIKEYIPLKVYEVETGYKAYDWEVPEEWNIRDAYIIDSEGNKVLDFKNNNLHVMGYSEPIDLCVSRGELENNLYSIDNIPNAIPYVTSYYKKKWGFCMSKSDRDNLKGDEFRVYIDSDFKHGSMTFGEIVIPGKLKEEVLISTYICHPSMANNECSGPVLATFLAKYLLSKNNLKYTYRFIFGPETIGPIVYISKNIKRLKRLTIAAFNLTCVGDNKCYSLMPSRTGNTYTDRIARHVLSEFKYKEYSFLDRGSDERQYCHPLVDLPMVSIMRSKYGTYSEYHNSLDDLTFINPEGLKGTYDVMCKCINIIEENKKVIPTFPCEPKLMKHGLVPKDWHKRRAGGKDAKKSMNFLKNVVNIISYCDGDFDILDISKKLELDFFDCLDIVDQLLLKNILRDYNEK